LTVIRDLRRISQEEARTLLDKAARRHLGLDAETFLREWDAGRFDGYHDPSALLHVTTLLPYVRPSATETPGEFFDRFANRPDVDPILDSWSK
jgi:hypothetical protein